MSGTDCDLNASHWAVLWIVNNALHLAEDRGKR
jgi:hypothetical protein